MPNHIEIEVDDLSDGRLIALLEDHRENMLKHSPVDSVHALDVNALHHPDMIFWRATVDGHLGACTGLKRLDDHSAEIKSMKTSVAFVRQGLAKALLDNLIEYAIATGYRNLYLETGSMDVFIPARCLYAKLGFEECRPFADYKPDPHSVFMRLSLI